MKQRKQEDLTLERDYGKKKNLIDLKIDRDYRRMMNSIPFLLIILILISFYYSLTNFHKAYETRDWKVANGTIIKSYLREEIKRRDREYYKTYKADIVYSYVVNGQKLKNDEISYLFHKEYSKYKLSLVIDKYPKGSMVKVYYNPENIKESLLDKSLKIGHYLMFIFGLLATFVFFKFKIYMYLIL